MSNRYRRYSKRELLGSLYVDYVMSVTDLGLAPKANRWDVLRAFLNVGEARAERLVEEPGGFLLLQSVPGRPNTGAIYVYIERLQAFFWLTEQTHSADPLLTAEDVAERLKVSRDWVWDHSSRRLPYLPVIRMSDGALRYRASQIEAFLSEREQASNLRRKRR
jgi:predicted DNA-binding transcriptional regulator AlpA